MFIECLLHNSQALLQGHYVETQLILSHTHTYKVQMRKPRPRKVTELAQSLLSLMKGTWNQTHTAWLPDAALLLED